MRNNFQLPADQYKVSVKKFKQKNIEERAFHDRQNNQHNNFQVPNHIETETQMQISARPNKFAQAPAQFKPRRRRKIFQKSTNKQYTTSNQKTSKHPTNTPQSQPQKLAVSRQTPQQNPIKINQSSSSNYYTLKHTEPMQSLYPNQKIKRNSPPSYYLSNESLSSQKGSNNEHSYSHYHSYGGSQSIVNNKVQKISSDQNQCEEGYNYGVKGLHAGQKLPSFAKGSENFEEVNRNYYGELDSMISVIPEEVRKIRNQMLKQKRDISELSEKLERNNASNYRKQKQLLGSLIQKQDQLSRKQRELNDSLQKMSKIQTESSTRYEQLLKYQLELQRAKRIELLTNQNQKLYQQLLKNQTKDTFELIPKVNTNNIHIRQNYYEAQPIMSAFSVSKNIKDEMNWREISALSYKGQGSVFVEGSQCEHNNTIRELLSPLEIKPDYTY